MRFLVSIIVVFHFTLLVKAQQPCTQSVAGRILSASGPLSGADVIITSVSKGSATNDHGDFVIRDLCPGEYVLEVRFVGFETRVITVVVPQSKPVELVMSPESKNLNEVIVQEKLEQVDRSANYAVLSGTQLQETAGKSLGESLKALPGVSTIQAGPGIFKPVIHGVHSQRVLILNHGIRQEGQQWGAEHAPEIDPFIASSIVVVKDAAAIKYGTDALGGVIVVNPAPLPEKAGMGGSVNTILQSNGRSGAVSGMLEGGVKNFEGWGWRVQGTAKRSGDFHARDYSLTNTGIKEFDFSAAAGYHAEKFGADVFFSHFQTELGILRGTAISNLNDLETAMETEPPIGTTNFSYAINHPKQQVAHNLLKINSHWERPGGEWHVQYGYQSNFRKEYDIRRGGLSELPSIDLELRTHTLEAEFETTNAKGQQFCFGLNGMYQDNRNVPGTQRIPFIPNYTAISGGPFAVGKFPIGQWTLDVGTRYDLRSYDVVGFDFSNTLYTANLLFHNVSASAGMSRKFGQKHQVKLNLSSAWRPPHVAELYSLGTHQSAAAIEYGLLLNDSTNRVMDISEVPFKVEQALKAVATYQYTTERIQVEATVYSNTIFNFIYLQPRGVTTNIRGTYPYFRYTQTDALFAGLDAEMDYNLSSRISLTAKVSLLSATDIRHDDYLVFIPSNRFETGFRFSSSSKRFFVQPKVSFVARQFRAPRVITIGEFNDAIENGTDPLGGSSKNFDFMEAPPGYMLAGLAIGYEWLVGQGKFDARLAAENLFNNAYREYTNRLRYYADDIGRNVSFSLKYTF
ncbi:MAG: TonB-dependent receptor [Cyclobacteriaceae bacterium]|nr:TonB-dependent receptor [Cyclobacteriaceae bacterium]